MSGETEEQQSGWTVDTLNYALSARITALLAMLDERYGTQTRARDAAFAAQQTAMRAAFEAADKAVATALSAAEKELDHRVLELQAGLEQARKEVQAALLSAREGMGMRLDEMDRRAEMTHEAIREAAAAALITTKLAIDKAEAAADRRFESVNEFRAQLADQAARFITRHETEAMSLRNAERIRELSELVVKMLSRSEAETQMLLMTDKLEAATGRNSARIAELAAMVERRLSDLGSRLDLNEGRDRSMESNTSERHLVISQGVAIAGVLVFTLSVAVSVIALLSR